MPFILLWSKVLNYYLQLYAIHRLNFVDQLAQLLLLIIHFKEYSSNQNYFIFLIKHFLNH